MHVFIALCEPSPVRTVQFSRRARYG